MDPPVSRHELRKKKKKLKKRRKQLSSFQKPAIVGDTADEEENASQTVEKDSSPISTVSSKRKKPDVPSNGHECIEKKKKTSSTEYDESLPFPSDASPADVLQWLIYPITLETFFAEYWEKKPLLIRRKKKTYYQSLFGVDVIDEIMRTNYMKFGVNLDLTKYTNGVRETLNPPGRVHPGTVWDNFRDGCSVRILNPQTFHKPLWKVTELLQHYFQCMVGANTYLTPADSQGFAPHYDDIEAFILQVEGAKRWRLYDNPEGQPLPRFSSRNFEQKEMGKPILDVILQSGDFLYFPRGIAHQAVSPAGTLSLHITLSTYQNNCWGTLMTKVLEGALAYAIEDDVEFREGLPRDYLDYMGVLNADTTDPRRKTFEKKISGLFGKLAKIAPIDASVDQLGVEFIHTSMPPLPSTQEAELSSVGRRAGPDTGFLMDQDTEIKLVRPYVAHLVIEDGQAVLYHSADNAKFHKGEVPQSIIFEMDSVPALEHLLKSDGWVDVTSLPELEAEAQIDMAMLLYDVGVVLARNVPAEEL
eukprot:m.145507 g.145507  ORF g.145507 m.145507 type:complete len:530 (+) comp14947_c0_seq1:147-1736(+)